MRKAQRLGSRVLEIVAAQFKIENYKERSEVWETIRRGGAVDLTESGEVHQKARRHSEAKLKGYSEHSVQ